LEMAPRVNSMEIVIIMKSKIKLFPKAFIYVAPATLRMGRLRKSSVDGCISKVLVF